MPVFECSRCNNLTYSASRFALLVCDVCGSNRQRILEHAFSFSEARTEPRDLCPGDHCCLSYEHPREAVPVAVRLIRQGLDAGGRVLVYVPGALESAIRAELSGDEQGRVDWGAADDVYGPGFDADDVIARFTALAESEPRTVYLLGGSARPLETLMSREEYARFERRATDVATSTGLVALCLLDRTLHASDHHLDGLHTHPLAADGDAVKRNERFAYA